MRRKPVILASIVLLGPVLLLGLTVGSYQLIQMAQMTSRVPDTLKGRVIDVRGKPVPGVALTFELLESRDLFPGLVEGPAHSSLTTCDVTTGPDGGFVISWKHQTLRLTRIAKPGSKALNLGAAAWNWSGGAQRVMDEIMLPDLYLR